MIYGSWDIRHNRQSILSFLPFDPSNNLKNQNFEKIIKKKKKKKGGRFYHFTLVYHIWRSYDLWFLRCGVPQTECFVILDHFCPFTPLNNPKIQTFENTKKDWRYIVILHKCYKNHDHMLYCSWYGAWQMWLLFFILGYFLPFNPPNSPKNEEKKFKKF